jgi:hypothetical protein
VSVRCRWKQYNQQERPKAAEKMQQIAILLCNEILGKTAFYLKFELYPLSTGNF